MKKLSFLKKVSFTKFFDWSLGKIPRSIFDWLTLNKKVSFLIKTFISLFHFLFYLLGILYKNKMARTKFNNQPKLTPRAVALRRAKYEANRESNVVASWDGRISKWNALCSLKQVLAEDPIESLPSSPVYITPKKARANEYTQWEQDLFNNYPLRPSKAARYEDEEAQRERYEVGMSVFSDLSDVSDSELTDTNKSGVSLPDINFIYDSDDTDDELSSIATIHTLIV